MGFPKKQSKTEESQLSGTRSRADLRREFIRKRVHEAGQVSHSEIEEAAEKGGFPVSRQSHKDDGIYFEAAGIPIKRVGRFFVRYLDEVWTYKLREDENRGAKRAMARVAVQLLLGGIQFDKEGEQTQSGWATIVSEMLKGPDNPGGVTRHLLHKLGTWFRKSSRVFALDGGTSNMRIAEELSLALVTDGLRIPNPRSNISSMTVITNSTRISRQLEEPQNPVDVIVLGGQLRKATLAVVGTLAEQCMERWQVSPDLAMVGTTAACATAGGDWACFSDSPDESRFKNLLFERSFLRIVVMDSSKCGRIRASAFPFSFFAPDKLDIVLTDEGILDDKHDEFRQAVSGCGIALLVAPELPKARGRDTDARNSQPQ
ncbi:MAG: hypothetical protein WD063_14580 [Pirellulales bacterium]